MSCTAVSSGIASLSMRSTPCRSVAAESAQPWQPPLISTEISVSWTSIREMWPPWAAIAGFTLLSRTSRTRSAISPVGGVAASALLASAPPSFSASRVRTSKPLSLTRSTKSTVAPSSRSTAVSRTRTEKSPRSSSRSSSLRSPNATRVKSKCGPPFRSPSRSEIRSASSSPSLWPRNERTSSRARSVNVIMRIVLRVTSASATQLLPRPRCAGFYGLRGR